MSSPLAPAICLFMLVLLGNSWADVRMALMDENVPMMDAVGSGTPSEEMFLKTVQITEIINMGPKCLVIVFDSRTLDPQKHRMGRLLLLGEPRPSFGTNDGANEWAASKVVCDQDHREAFMFLLSWLGYLHEALPMELGQHEKEVRKVLKQKEAEMVKAGQMVFKFEYGGS